MNKKGIVYLVGAGPGDPGLITLKGAECLRKADVVVYDRLAAPGLLAFARPGAEMVYAGKSPDRHSMGQAEINNLLVDRAGEGKVVVRLKGGDPFVFGRGGEEAEVLAEKGISFEVVPGVTAAVAVPAYAGIPVTHRACTATLAVVTGNEDPDKDDSAIAWDKIATGAGTIVFLMGMANLPRIIRRLVENGRALHTPVALIRWGTRPEQDTIVGTLADINEKAAAAGFKNPAVIVVGEVVALRDKLNWFERKPLFGRRVLVTRSREQASALSAMIADLGGEPVEFPTIQVAGPLDFGPLDEAIDALETYRWVVFTSVNGVSAFFKRLRRHKKDVRALHAAALCAIGPKTREALEQYGLMVEYVPEEYRAEEIVAGLSKKIKPGERVLLPRADIARKVLPEALRQMGAMVDEVTAYRTVVQSPEGSRGTGPGGGRGGVTPGAEKVRAMLEAGEIQIITFTSSSTVRNFVRLLEAPDLGRLLSGVKTACIGPVTADTARELGIRVDVVASEYTIEGLVEAIKGLKV
jgi:uroporphyrinogen III methyltransferase/synthase